MMAKIELWKDNRTVISINSGYSPQVTRIIIIPFYHVKRECIEKIKGLSQENVLIKKAKLTALKD